MIPVLNKKTDVIPKGAVYIGRPSPFGNPFPIRGANTRDVVVDKFKWYFLRRAKEDLVFRGAIKMLKQEATALVCFCAPLKCHGDVIAEYLETLEG
jgi:hypothetical protein